MKSTRPSAASFARHLTSRPLATLLLVAAAGVSTLAVESARGQSPELLGQLNAPLGRISESSRSATRLFTAYLDLTKPPQEVGAEFNQTTIYPGMDGFDAVAKWASDNSGMGKALLELQGCQVIGVPYGTEGVDPKFIERGLYAAIAPEGDLTRADFPYLKALQTISAYAVAEMYRLCEAGKFDEAFALGVAHLRILRQGCDAEMYDEKAACMTMLADAMSVHRDVLFAYDGKIELSLLDKLASKEYPFLKSGDNERLRRLTMPEGDLLVARELLKSVCDEGGQPDGAKFAKAFAGMQARMAPMSAFGAVKRWERVAGVHGSLEASTIKLNAIYDDWWRRWRMRAYDPMMGLPTELSVVNPVKYAAVVFSARDIETLFALRRRLTTEFCGLVASCGLVGYRAQLGAWPNEIKMAYVRFPKRFDFDPYDPKYGAMKYEFLGSRTRGIETSEFGRLEASGCILYARSDDNTFEGAQRHAAGGKPGDFVVWPPVRALSRAQSK